MNAAGLHTLVTSFFVKHLAAERSVSRHTAAAYRDAIKLLLRFAAEAHHRDVGRLTIQDLSADLILRFLEHLESKRRNSVRTCNARLAAVHCFFRYVMIEEPAFSSLSQRVLAIPFRRTRRPALGYLMEQELEHLLAQIDRSTTEGERDYVLLALLYDTGARIQEVLDLKPEDFRQDSPPFVRVMGKGRRERLCPLLPQTAKLLARFLREQAPESAATPILRNRCGGTLTRHGARYLLNKYLDRARETMPSLKRSRISAHTLRHTKGMHLLQSGVPLVTIKDVLGHADLKSTEIYVQADLEMKRHALEFAGSVAQPRRRARRATADLLAWLSSI
jgi:site-specific recombinase XerD